MYTVCARFNAKRVVLPFAPENTEKCHALHRNLDQRNATMVLTKNEAIQV